MRRKCSLRGLNGNNDSLTVYGCASHFVNLLGNDVTPSQVIILVTEINKYIRNHNGPGALLMNQKASIKPQLPVVTRWNSQLECYLTNKPYLLIILAQNEDVIETTFANFNNNIGLYREAIYLYDHLQPIAISLDKLQADESNIADSCEEWLNLLELVQLSNYHTKIQQSFTKLSHQLFTTLLIFCIQNTWDRD